MTWNDILKATEVMLRYLGPTLKVFFYTLLFSIPLGVVVAVLRKVKFKPVSWLTAVYILIMRGTPLMLQIITEPAGGHRCKKRKVSVLRADFCLYYKLCGILRGNFQRRHRIYTDWSV